MRMLRCCSAYQLSKFVERCLPPLCTNLFLFFFFFIILGSSIVMVRLAQHNVFFPPLIFSY